MNDYHQIQVERKGTAGASFNNLIKAEYKYKITEGGVQDLTPEMTNEWHQEQVDWIINTTAKIRLSDPERHVVVLTHHAPSSYDCLWPETRGQVLAMMQYDELEHLMKPPMVSPPSALAFRSSIFHLPSSVFLLPSSFFVLRSSFFLLSSSVFLTLHFCI